MAKAQAPVISDLSFSLTSLLSFTGDHGLYPGASPSSGLVQGVDGNFYGTTYGDNYVWGTVFTMTPGGAFTPMYSFSGGADGARPTAELVEGNDNNFYGTAGSVFKITRSGSLATLYSLQHDASGPTVELAKGSDGKFYGTTCYGGISLGSVFKITSSGSLTSLCSFNGSNGMYPTAGLVQGSDGDFYGTTSYGGGGGNGTVFRVTSSGSLTTMCVFTGSNGATPQAKLMMRGDGYFYGTTTGGGNSGKGTVFKIDLNGSLTTLYSFSGPDGSSPCAGLVQGNDGNLYGTTQSGGDNDKGTVFQITPGGSLTTLFSFSGYDGATPVSRLVLGRDGTFYGTTQKGGSTGSGTVFKLVPPNYTLTVGSPAQYQIAATNSPVSYGATGLPAGMVVDTAAGIISGTPTQTGVFPVILMATNADGTGSGTLNVIVETPEPKITSAPWVTVTVGLPFSYGITATKDPTSYDATDLPSGLSLNTATGLIHGALTTTGTFNSTIRAFNLSGTGSSPLKIVSLPPTPVITGTLSVTGIQNAAFSYQITATNNPFQYSGTGLPIGLWVDNTTGLITGTPYSSGTFSANIAAKNGGGTTTAVLTIVVLPPPPVISNLPYTITTGTTSSVGYWIFASNSPTSYSATGLPPGIQIDHSSGGISGTATKSGTFNATISATNTGGTGSAPMTFVVIPSPVINSSLAIEIQEYLAINYQITATGGPISFAATGLPTWLTLNSTKGLITGTAAVTGTYNASITATSYYGEDTEGITIVVGPPPPPTIISALSVSGTQNALFNYQIGATYVPTSYDSEGLPPGLNIDKSSGVISGIPTKIGTTNITISATNAGGTTSATLVISIPVPPAPKITNVPYALQTLCSFTGVNGPFPGSNPQAGLIQGNDGALYGAAYWGGVNDRGTIFRITTSGSFTQLVALDYTNTGAQANELVLGSDGNFYGTTQYGGTGSVGTVFKMSASGSLTKLYEFTGGSTGANPHAGLVEGADGNFYGTTNQGGAYNHGTVFKISPSGTLTSLCLFSFNTSSTDDSWPDTSLIMAIDGNFYGMSNGISSSTVYRIAPDGTRTHLYNFAYPVTGAFASGALLQATDGNLYGGSSYKNSSGSVGSIFRMTTSGSATCLATFDGRNGGCPSGKLIQGSDGKFYGTTYGCGTPSLGTVFSMTTSGSLATLCAFSGANGIGANPNAGVLQLSDGSFYGTTYNGGALGLGTVFRAVPQAVTANAGASFIYQITADNIPTIFGASGLPPGLNIDASTGLITGIPAQTGTFNASFDATNAGGTGNASFAFIVLPSIPSITSAPTASGTQNSVFSYQITATNNPAIFTATGLPAGLSIDTGSGLISGTPAVTGTFSVGLVANNSGGTGTANVVIALAPPPPVVVTNNIVSLASFGGTNGANPQAGLVQGSDGNFYGTTYSGGGNNSGTVFRISASGSFVSLYSFGGSFGTNPQAGLVQGPDGSFYGTTYNGGTWNKGTVFKITSSGSLATLCTFNVTNGANPKAGLVRGSDGNFYGTTYYGGSSNYGTVFKMASSGSLSTLYSFTSIIYGYPQGGLVQDKYGYFFGTGNYGLFGITSAGVQMFGVFPSGGPFYGGIVQGNDGNFYGTTYNSGSNNSGSVFRVTSSGSTTILCAFGGTNGSKPQAGLVQGKDGNFYGTTYYGGSNNKGTLFQITSSGSLTSLFSFNGTNGANPYAGLVQGSDGSFYGTTYYGGTGDRGTVFKYVPQKLVATRGSAFSWQITALYNPASYDAVGLPDGLQVNTVTGLISGVPVVSGTFDITINATNITGTGSGILTITVIPPPPVIQKWLSAYGSKGLPFSYQVAASNDPFSYSATGLPGGLSINPSAGVISGTPTTTGTFLSIVKATNISGSGSANLWIFLRTPYETWQSQQFSSTQLGDLAASGDAAAPAGDGISNLMKYALHLNPMTIGTPRLPVSGTMVDSSNNTYLTLTYTQAVSAVDITYIPEVSDDMQTWNSGPTYTAPVSVTNNPDGVTKTMIVQDLVPVNSSPTRFIRLKVTKP